eukprot:10369905-Lingulodinium_polyedra.AAC.1
MLQGILLPSPASLSRARFYADLAWMRTMARKHQALIEGGGLLFGMLDSSPQGGRNWLLSEYTCLLPDSLDRASEALETMWAM